MEFRGSLFRATNPIYAREPLSGEGARLHGGRFNRRGRPALYLALDPVTVIREMARGGTLQPTVVVEISAEIENLFDTRDPAALAMQSANVATLADPAWRLKMLSREPVPTHELSEKLIARGHPGMIVRSFAPGTGENDLNIVLWKWGENTAARLRLVDDEGRLR